MHRIWQRKVLGIGAGMFAGVLLIASCSSSSHSSSLASSSLASNSSPSTSSAGSSSASNSATTAAAGPPSGTPVGIATINPDTGAGNLKPVGDGLAAFIAYANSTQGFGGRPGVQKRCDYANDPGKAADCARSEVADTSVLVAAGGEGRYSDLVVSTEAGASDPLPNVCAGLNTPGEGKATNTICLAAGSDIYNYLDMSYFKKHNPTFVKGYCITADSAAGHNTCGTAAGYATGLGMTLTQAFFSPTTADFLPAAQAALGAKPDFILLGAAPVQELALIKAFITLGSTTPIGSYSILVPQSSLPQIAAANFPIAVDAQFPDEATSTDPEIVLYRDWMQKQGFGTEIGDLSLSGWIAGRVVQAAVAATNTAAAPTTRAKILTFLRTAPITGIPLEPDPLSLQLAPKQTPGLTSVANPSAHVALIQHGHKTITNETVAIP